MSIDQPEQFASEETRRADPSNLRRDLATLLDRLYGLNLRPGHLDAVLEVIDLHSPVSVPVNSDITTLRATLEERTRERDELEGWKADALQSLTGWHHLGDVLLALAPGRMGVVIPDHLAVAVPALIASLRSERDGWEEQEATEFARAEAAEATLTAAHEVVARWRVKVQRFRDDSKFAAASSWVEDCADELAAALTASPAAQKEQGICMFCDGTGWCEGSPAFTCPRCKGSGASPAAQKE